jgi:hypothetical protein
MRSASITKARTNAHASNTVKKMITKAVNATVSNKEAALDESIKYVASIRNITVIPDTIRGLPVLSIKRSPLCMS